jgi:hypothetical protein
MTWAARYAFCDPLWRGRTRLIVDAELEAVMRATVERRVSTDAPWRTLVEALVPRERSVATWMVVGSEATARLLAPYYGGVRFVVADAIDDRFARLPWETALVTLDARTDGGASARPPASHGVASRTVEAILVDVAAACGPGRIAVVTAMGPNLDYDGFVEQLRPTFGEVRVYGGYAPSMFAFVEFRADEGDDAIAGELDTGDDDPQTFRIRAPAVIEPQPDDRWDDGDAPDDEDDPVPLAFDNTLGPDEPPCTLWIGVLGSTSDFGEGLTLIELSADGGPASSGGDPRAAVVDVADESTSTALRRQLQETRKVAELGALERQRLVERIDALEADNAALREATLQLREQLAGALDPAVTGERLDAALAREQSLRWRVAALERECNELRVRPVEELTAELEALRARTTSVQAEPDQAHGPMGATSAADPQDGADDRGVSRSAQNPDAARRIATRHAVTGRTAALHVVEALVRRIDRGSIERTSLRRELAALRRRLGA